MHTLFKFICVGAVNTALDLSVLNLLVVSFGTGNQGELFVLFKTISFVAAVINSYLLNKLWVFGQGATSGAREPALFFIVSAFGFLVNVSISFAVFTLGTHVFSAQFAATIGALAGTGVVFAWNFIGYRFLVFKKRYEY